MTTWQENPWRPFCSEKCKLTDLGRWASGEYRLEGEPAAPDSDHEGDSETVPHGREQGNHNDRRDV